MDRRSYDGLRPSDKSEATEVTQPLNRESGALSGLGSPSAGTTALQQALSEMTHDINNPLAIISGNAQLLLELARMLDLDPDVAKPIQDIEEASHRLAETLRRLDTFKETLDPPPSGDGI